MVNSWTSTKTMSSTCDEEEDGQQLDLRLAPLADFTSTSHHTPLTLTIDDNG